jgi:hypothetical protein
MFKMYGVKNRSVYMQNRHIYNNEVCYVPMTTIPIHSYVQTRLSIPVLPVRFSTLSILKYVAAATSMKKSVKNGYLSN